MAAIYQTGIDVSRYQGTIDWAAVARAGKQFAVIRAVSSNNSGVYVDPMFEKNYAGAKAAGLRVGVYYYTYAQTESYADRELEALTAVLAGKKLEYPVFVDGKFELLMPEDEKIFAYTRTNGDSRMLVCANFSGEQAECPLLAEWVDAEVLIHNYPGEWSKKLRPYEAVILIQS